MNRLKSVGAVLAGVAANFLAVPLDAVLHATGVYPPPGAETDAHLALAFAYRALFAVLGGAVTTRLAPSSPRAHAVALGAVGLVLSSAGAAAQWGLGHHWYPLSLIALCLPASLAGARFTTRS
ncbi:MAG: hypothetical protein U0228_37910 [Myxococcaceae bacterium]